MTNFTWETEKNTGKIVWMKKNHFLCPVLKHIFGIRNIIILFAERLLMNERRFVI
jgi:hypothetical protein